MAKKNIYICTNIEYAHTYAYMYMYICTRTYTSNVTYGCSAASDVGTARRQGARVPKAESLEEKQQGVLGICLLGLMLFLVLGPCYSTKDPVRWVGQSRMQDFSRQGWLWRFQKVWSLPNADWATLGQYVGSSQHDKAPARRIPISDPCPIEN